ncbi:MAG: ABC transporter permease [Acidimicrobiia bacterium]|nr:ABC transporter permease [Acidimicrobiia bacterium]
MFNYIVRRLVYGLVTLIALSIIVFSLLQMSGGGPLNRLRSNPRITQEYVQSLEDFYGLDEPAWVQYRIWATNYVQGEWGISFQGTQPVFDIIKSRTGATLRLMLTALFLAVMIGVPFGIYQALRQYSFFDQLGTTVSFVTFSTPIFLIAIAMQILFAVYLERWTGVKFLYTGGMNDPGYDELGTLARFGDTIQHLMLPAIAIALISIAVYARFQRASMLEVYHSDYLRTAKAKGLPRRRVIFKHALRNALIPIVTLISLDIAALIGGAIITETIFSWPGLGRQYINAIGTLDYPMVMAIVMALGIGVVVMNLIADIAYGFLDPRVRYD